MNNKSEAAQCETLRSYVLRQQCFLHLSRTDSACILQNAESEIRVLLQGCHRSTRIDTFRTKWSPMGHLRRLCFLLFPDIFQVAIGPEIYTWERHKSKVSKINNQYLGKIQLCIKISKTNRSCSRHLFIQRHRNRSLFGNILNQDLHQLSKSHTSFRLFVKTGWLGSKGRHGWTKRGRFRFRGKHWGI